MAFTRAFLGGFIGRIVGAIFVAACIYFGFGPDYWVMLIAGQELWPWAVRAAFVLLGLLTLFFITRQWAAGRRSMPVVKFNWRGRLRKVRVSSVLFTIAIFLIAAGLIAGTAAIAMRSAERGVTRTTKAERATRAEPEFQINYKDVFVYYDLAPQPGQPRVIEKIQLGMTLYNPNDFPIFGLVEEIDSSVEGRKNPHDRRPE